MVTITFSVPDEHAPALRSVIEHMSHMIGSKLEGVYSFPTEAAFTRAACVVGTMRAAVNKALPHDPLPEPMLSEREQLMQQAAVLEPMLAATAGIAPDPEYRR